MRVIFDPERNALTVLREESFFTSGQLQQRFQPALPAAHDVEYALANSVMTLPWSQRKVLLQLRLQAQKVPTYRALVNGSIHRSLLIFPSLIFVLSGPIARPCAGL